MLNHKVFFAVFPVSDCLSSARFSVQVSWLKLFIIAPYKVCCQFSHANLVSVLAQFIRSLLKQTASTHQAVRDLYLNFGEKVYFLFEMNVQYN